MNKKRSLAFLLVGCALLMSSLTRAVAADQVAGVWQLVQAGHDKNGNGALENDERESLDRITGGFDYLDLRSNRTCVYDREIQFDGTWSIKTRDDKTVIHIYPERLPAGMSEAERDSHAFRYYLVSVDKQTLVLRPAHLGRMLVVYTRK